MEEQITNEGQQPPQTPDRNKHIIIYAILGAVIIVLTLAVIYLWTVKDNQPTLPLSSDDQARTTVGDGQNQPLDTQTSSTTLQDQIKDLQQQPLPENYVRIEWKKEWEALPVQKPDDYIQRVLAGKIVEGPYAGFDIFIEIERGLGTSYRHYVVEKGEKIYFDEKNIKVLGIHDIPETIDFPGTGYKLKKNYIANEPFKSIKLVRKLFTDPKLGDFYLTEEGCFVTELPDHTAITYDFVLPFMGREDRILNATFNDNQLNQDSYTYTRIMSCGALCMYMAIKDEIALKPFERLTEVGKTSNNEILYGLKDPNDLALKGLYDDKNTVAYYNTTQGYQRLSENKYTYAEFLKYRPLLYWQDPLGRWIEFKNDRFQVAAEMCKPVIYLYPENVMNLTVKVNPNGGFIYSTPAYGTGWEVKAWPNGALEDLKTGKEYPYLFWEGIGLNYPEQTEGFVVKRADIDKFLSEKLTLLGLNDKESAEFKAYWVPRLTGFDKPYVKISFLTKEQFDQLAPLNLSPIKPNSVIRVMMTAKGLDRYEVLPEQELPVPQKRAGFVVVEWGGVVLK